MKVAGQTLLIMLAALFATPASAEACKVFNGVDYRFDRQFATRRVDDAGDRGTIRLATYIYTPLKRRSGAVVLFSHGSTGGFDFDPREPQPIVQCSLKNYFLQRGYTLVAFARRGRGESTGTYVEECDRRSDKACTPAATRLISDRALASGLADLDAVFSQIVAGRIGRSGSPTLLAGHSRGAMLSLALAARYPQRIAGVLNFSGGWLGMQDGLGEAELSARLRYQEQLVERFATYRGPSLWLYADRDPLYDDRVTRALHGRFVATGGQGGYDLIQAPSLENGHLLVQESPFWAATVDRFLASLPTGAGGAGE